MIRNYWKTAVRFILKNRTFSFINIVGLSIGTLCCLYILVYVDEQYSYDKWENHAADIYRVRSSIKLSGDRWEMASSSPAIAPGMKRDFPEVQEMTRVFDPRLFGEDQHLFKYKEKAFYEKEVFFVDSTFFDVFNYRLMRGDASQALRSPFTVVLTPAVAEKLFGDEDPIGKTIQIVNKTGVENLKVTGVIDERNAGRSHMSAKIFVTMNSGSIGNIIRDNDVWGGSNMVWSYVKLRPGTDAAQLEKKLVPLLEHYGGQEMRAAGLEKVLHLQAIAAIHTTPGLINEVSLTVGSGFLSILLLIALLIQVMACINFMNLSTARATSRAKEVGVRKVIGAGRTDLIRQFLAESLLLSLIGVALAIPLLLVLLPYLNGITRANISFSFFSDSRFWMGLTALVGCTSLLAGSYPAFYLSAFEAIRVIKGNFTNRISASGIRRSLVVFQFGLSIVLITGIVIIYSQLDYIKNKDLGYNTAQKLILNVYTAGVGPGLMTELRGLSGVKEVTKSSAQLGSPMIGDEKVYRDGSDLTHGEDADMLYVDQYFPRTAGFRFISGHDFGDHDSDKVILNETLARRLRVEPRKAEGMIIHSSWPGAPVSRYIVKGVVKDFNVSSLHKDVRPLMLICRPGSPMLSSIMIDCNTSDYATLLGRIDGVWHRYAPGVPLQYTFLDEDVQKQYETEITLAGIINLFTGMAILISCLGLFGLAAFSAEQRSKEIGVRKVLGASVTGIVTLLSADLVKLMAVALLIATPVSWWVMHQWLQGFAYRVEMSWWMFVVSGLAAILVALLTVGFHTVRAAMANPVRSLRNE
jgi:putative ABC transport system permease protein